MVSIIFVGFQPPKLYLNLNIISQLSQLFDSSIPSVLMVISHCCWGSSCASERNRWFWPAKKAEICSEFRQCQQWRRFKSSVPAKKKIQQETINENRDFFPRHNGFSVFFLRIPSECNVLRSVPVQTSRLGSTTWWPHHGDLLELSIVIPVRLVAYGLVFQKTIDLWITPAGKP